MNLPNNLTISRILLTVIFLIFLFADGIIYKVIALVVFIAAALTDYLDGYIAKKRGMVSDFGKFMDPVADKILTLSAFLAFVEMGLIPAWMVMIIIFREFIITGIRLMALRKRKVIEATLAGKHKTVSQMTAIIAILVYIILVEYGHHHNMWTKISLNRMDNGIFIIMFITVILTVVSGVSFFMRNKDIFYEKESH
ncbi:MAG: CDP-diacylglycerol--glycerol-3-phosphate 3-phosphatidyltransferase [Candidatus Omnitrophica bacterium]|nr:CDP-diacylglycerol--glycerol-3-phosphate 3-phosphatidyltransferase [Candidatus Omnitrophota bacterium]